MSNQSPSSTTPAIVSRPLSMQRLIDLVDDAGELFVGQVVEDAIELMRCVPENISGSPVPSAESGDEAVVEVDRREAIAFRRMAQRQRGQRVALAPRARSASYGGNWIVSPLTRKNSSSLSSSGRTLAHAAAGAEDLRLERKLESRAAGVRVAQIALDRLGQVMQVDDEVARCRRRATPRPPSRSAAGCTAARSASASCTSPAGGACRSRRRGSSLSWLVVNALVLMLVEVDGREAQHELHQHTAPAGRSCSREVGARAARDWR